MVNLNQNPSAPGQDEVEFNPLFPPPMSDYQTSAAWESAEAEKSLTAMAPSRLVPLMVISIFISETLIMAVLQWMPPFSPVVEALIDSAMLLIILSPTFYYFHYRPLRTYYLGRKIMVDKLCENEERLNLALEGVNDGLWDWNVMSGEVYFSPRWVTMLGYMPDEVEPNVVSWERLIHPDDRDMVSKVLKEHLDGKSNYYEVEHRLLDRTREEIWILARGQVVARDKQNRAVRMVGTHTDITERKRAEQALYRANKALRTLSSSNSAALHAKCEYELLEEVCRLIVNIGKYQLAWVGMAEISDAKKVLPVAKAGYDEGFLSGIEISWANDELGSGPVGTAMRTGMPVVVNDVSSDEGFEPWRKEALARGYSSIIALPLMAGTKIIGTLNIHCGDRQAFDEGEKSLLLDLANSLAHGIIALREGQERRKAEAALRYSEEETRRLSQQLMNNSEEEKKHLAQDLHDEFGQVLTAFQFGVEMLKNRQFENEADYDFQCSRLLDLVAQLEVDLRHMCDHLRPVMLDDIGLVETLGWHIKEFSKQTKGIEADLEVSGVESRLPKEIEIVLYRICQESLHNVVKHARASRVSVQLLQDDSGVKLIVKDNGQGMTGPRKRPMERGSWGIGLLGMRERAGAVGGHLLIETEEGQGTTIQAEIPIEKIGSVA